MSDRPATPPPTPDGARTTYGPWRRPAEESVGLYPGLTVCDNRVSGSITIGPSRLPWWCLTGELVLGNGWKGVEHGWGPEEHYGFTAEDAAGFLHDLLELRGEFGRLLLVLADAERCERYYPWRDGLSWWETKKHRKRVADQLRRCLAVLTDDEAPDPGRTPDDSAHAPAATRTTRGADQR